MHILYFILQILLSYQELYIMISTASTLINFLALTCKQIDLLHFLLMYLDFIMNDSFNLVFISWTIYHDKYSIFSSDFPGINL